MSKAIKKVLPAIFAILIVCIVVVWLYICNPYKLYEYNGDIAPYLHEITYEDYTVDKNFKTLNSSEVFGCSSVRNGNFVGRNLDLIYNDNPEFIVHVKSNEKHLASVGVACHNGLREQALLDGKYNKELEYIPNHTYDGINENGVYCNINVVPSEDTESVTGTNPNADETVHVGFVVRYVLDHAQSAKHAVKLLERINIIGDIMGFNAHYMICDKDNTIIAEIINNKVQSKEYTGDQQIMTNFYKNDETINAHMHGYGRYCVLQNNYNEGSTFNGMFDLLRRVRYSNTYKSENFKDVADEFLSVAQIQNEKSFNIANENYPNVCSEYNKMLQDENRDFGREKGYWITTHNTTYNLSNKSFQIVVQEDYDHKYVFNLNK